MLSVEGQSQVWSGSEDGPHSDVGPWELQEHVVSVKVEWQTAAEGEAVQEAGEEDVEGADEKVAEEAVHPQHLPGAQ